jgi:hypothetical protein
MRNGAELYSHIEPRYQLFDGSNAASGQVCFETFPHAGACAIAGKIVSAKQKRIVRSELLLNEGIDTTRLTNIDMIDAALCALAAYHLLAGDVRTYGEAKEGFIVVPGKSRRNSVPFEVLDPQSSAIQSSRWKQSFDGAIDLLGDKPFESGRLTPAISGARRPQQSGRRSFPRPLHVRAVTPDPVTATTLGCS